MKMLGLRYNLPKPTIFKILKIYKEHGSNERRKGSGRVKKSFSSEIEKLRLENEILKKYQAFLKVQLEEK